MKKLFFPIALLAWLAVGAQSFPNKPIFMPYCDATLWPLFDISKTDSSKVCSYVLAFVVDDPGQAGANPRWGGYSVYDTTHYKTFIQQLRNKGGDVMVSFGGANGIDLASATTSLSALVTAYREVIDAYQLKYIDFDIEGSNVANAATIDLRNKAMVQLKQIYPKLKIWLTLPVLPTGLDFNGLNVLRTAVVNYNIDIDGVNIMTMDYGSGGDMGNHAMLAGDSLFAQMSRAFSDAGISKTPAQIWKKIGLTPMIGQNDVMSEIFNQSDANDVYNYAVSRNIGVLSMWSINRDRACNGPSDPLYACTKITQAPFEFAGIFRGPNGYLDNCGTSSVVDEDVESNISIFPNPASEWLMVRPYQDRMDPIIVLKDLSGRVISELRHSEGLVSLPSLGAGFYIVSIKVDGKLASRKLIISR